MSIKIIFTPERTGGALHRRARAGKEGRAREREKRRRQLGARLAAQTAAQTLVRAVTVPGTSTGTVTGREVVTSYCKWNWNCYSSCCRHVYQLGRKSSYSRAANYRQNAYTWSQAAQAASLVCGPKFSNVRMHCGDASWPTIFHAFPAVVFGFVSPRPTHSRQSNVSHNSLSNFDFLRPMIDVHLMTI